MCSGRVDLRFILRAFSNGNDGVFIGGCRLNECNYVTHGNYDALAVTHICRKLLGRVGVNPERLQITFMSGGDGNILAEAVSGFTAKIKELGPLGAGEGIDRDIMRMKLAAVDRLVPFLRLAERERMRAPSKSKAEYDKFFGSDEFDKLFDDVVADKLAMSEIMLLLGQKPLSTGELAEILSLSPSEVSRHMQSSSRHGWVKYDVDRKCYSLA
jgi:coenzyme F420-reducing hydrogenase delta subunit